MQVSYRSNHVTLGDDFKKHVDSKLKKIVSYAERAQRLEVRAAGQGHGSSSQVSVELTLIGKSPVVRAEAADNDKERAFDKAYDKLVERLRRARDRRKNHYGRRDAINKSMVGLDLAAVNKQLYVNDQPEEQKPDENGGKEAGENSGVVENYVPVYIRQKRFKPEVMSVDEAIDRMELLGHAFFLFIDEASGEPSLVYHRHGWTYGEITLSDMAADEPDSERYLKYRP